MRRCCFPATVLLAALLALAPGLRAEPADLLSEADLLADIPRVYSAGRLPQLAQDSAGATTVMDREWIQASGARDLAELLRQVPGMAVANPSGGRPVVSYHGLSSQVSQRMQVFIDGRSVYAPYLFGGVDWAMLSVPLSEVERIEVQRGSNSVVYGANAFLGVVHITTRSAAQSVGFRASVAEGSGLQERHVRVGHNHGTLQWRLAAGQRGDDGLQGLPDNWRTRYVDLRLEQQWQSGRQLTLLAGATQGRFGIGFEGRASDPPRMDDLSSGFAQLRLREVVDTDTEWTLAATYARDSGQDRFSIPLLGQQLAIENRRQAERYGLEYGAFSNLGPGLRASWGVEYSQDRLKARQLFGTDAQQVNEQVRAYLNQEWMASQWLTLNAGLLVEKDRLAPLSRAARVGVNLKPLPNHVIKLSRSSAFRSPSLFEQRSNWQVVAGNQVLEQRYFSSGGLRAEQIRATELVYLGKFPSLDLSVDLRLFDERMSRLITGELAAVNPVGLASATLAYDLRNNAEAHLRGHEAQLLWRPSPSTWVSYAWYRANPSGSKAAVRDSLLTATDALSAGVQLPAGVQLSLSWSSVDAIGWLDEATRAEAQEIVALRVAQRQRLAGMNWQWSANWREPLGNRDEFRERQQLIPRFWLGVAVEY